MENFASKKETSAFWASINLMLQSPDKTKPLFLKGPFKSGIVYQGLNCSPEHRAAVQSAYDSLPQTVRDAFERTGYHMEAVGTSLDLAVRLGCQPPKFALGVTNHDQDIVMVAHYAVGPSGDFGLDEKGIGKPIRGKEGISVEGGEGITSFASTLAHEIGHVLDRCCTVGRGVRDDGFIKAACADLEHGLTPDNDDPILLNTIASTGSEPQEVFAECFSFAIGFGGNARGTRYAEAWPRTIEYVRGWFERNYNNFDVRLAA